MRKLTLLVPSSMVAAVAALAFTASASAGVLVSSAAGCDSETLSQPFLPWLDPNNYVQAPGGTFEAGAPAWNLTGNAAVASGNESFSVTSPSDSSSLALPAGSSATSPAQCVGIDHPTVRFFARNGGSSLSSLRVDVLWEDAFGNVNSTTIGAVGAGSSWQPTAPLVIGVNLLPLLPGNETAVAFRFTPQGSGGDWHIDDVYVDPWSRS